MVPLRRILRMPCAQVYRQRQVVLTIHHAIHDAFSINRILTSVAEAYQGMAICRPPSYTAYMRYVQNQQTTGAQFWQGRLEHFDSSPWPPRQSSQSSVEGFRTLTISISTPSQRSQVTLPTVLKAAWSLVCSDYSGSPQVSYGMTVMGRNVPVEGIEAMTGPTFSTVPVFVSVDSDTDVTAFLQEIQQLSLDMMPFEHFGLQNISRLSPQAGNACRFHNLPVIQTPAERDDPAQIPGIIRESSNLDEFSNYPINIVCQPNADGVQIQTNFDSDSVDGFQVGKIVEHYAHLIEQLSQAQGDVKLKDLDKLSAAHARQILSWNHSVSASATACLHDNFDTLVKSQPEAPAVDSWDGQWSYAELHQRGAVLATKLLDLGVKRGDLIPFCFEKSKWVVVAMLATLRVGATLVPLDPEHPESRLRDILSDAQSKMILCSSQHQAMCATLVDHALVVSQGDTDGFDPSIHIHFPVVSPDTPFTCLFTSGSTGRPKGALLEHRDMTSMVATCASKIGWNPTSRVLHFSSHAFDACMLEVWATLTIGGCVCIPSEAARVDDLVGVLNDFRVEILGTTASVVRTMRPDQVPHLKSLIVGGEYVTQDLVELWSPTVDMTIVYGPCECCIISTTNRVNGSSFTDHVGFGTGCVTWIVDPEDHNKLAPIGCVGECVLQGPNVGRGYLHDEERTRATYIREPPWAIGAHPKDSRRFYKTGDLVQYHSSGALRYVGRKDSQVKVRGQRLELGEIEQRLDTNPLVRNVLTLWPRLGRFRGKVVTILNLHAQPALPVSFSTSVTAVDLTDSEWRDAVRSIQKDLSQKLPLYMVPSTWFLVEQIPQPASRKLNRRATQSWIEGEGVTAEYAMGLDDDEVLNEGDPTLSDFERNIQDVWATVLSVSSAKLKTTTSFVKAGGDSISAMRVVASCRTKGIWTTVVDVLQSRSIRELASRSHSTPNHPPRPSEKALKEADSDFRLLRRANVDIDSILNGSGSGLGRDDIQDAYPCTPLQHAMLDSNARDPSLHAAHLIWRTNLVRGPLDVDRLVEAWKCICLRHTALRTVFLPVGSSWVQVVVRHEKFDLNEHIMVLHSNEVNTIEELRSIDRPRYKAGASLQRLIICQIDGAVYIRFDMIHALLDGISFETIESDMGQAMATGLQSSQEPLMGDVIQHVYDSGDGCAAYWHNYLNGRQTCTLPMTMDTEMPSVTPEESTVRVISFDVPSTIRNFCQGQDVLPSSFIQTVWAISLSALTGNRQVCFGYLVSGRHLDISGIEKSVGPYLSLLTQRVMFQQGQLLSTALSIVSDDNAASLQHVHARNEGKRGLFNTVINHRRFPGMGEPRVDSPLRMEWITSHDPWDYDMVIEVNERAIGSTTVEFRYRNAGAAAAFGTPHAATFRAAFNLL